MRTPLPHTHAIFNKTQMYRKRPFRPAFPFPPPLGPAPRPFLPLVAVLPHPLTRPFSSLFCSTMLVESLSLRSPPPPRPLSLSPSLPPSLCSRSTRHARISAQGRAGRLRVTHKISSAVIKTNGGRGRGEGEEEIVRRSFVYFARAGRNSPRVSEKNAEGGEREREMGLPLSFLPSHSFRHVGESHPWDRDNPLSLSH